MNVGLLSVAHLHAHAYGPILAGLDGVDLVGVADTDPERGAAFAATYDIAYRPAEDLLAACDAAIVCAPNTAHRDWIDRAAEAGVAVLSEKPLATTTADAAAIVDRCAAADVPLGVAMPLRFSPPVERARDALAEIGQLQFVVGWNRGRMPGGWFVDPEQAGGGAVQDHTVHILDLVRWMTDREVAEVHAETGTRLHDIPVEDVNVLSMALDDGTPVTLDGSWSRPDAWHNWGDAGAEIIGTEGVVSFEHTAQTIRVTNPAADPPMQLAAWGTDANERMLQAFIDAARTGRDPETTGVDGLREVAVVEAAYASAEAGAPVDVDYPR